MNKASVLMIDDDVKLTRLLSEFLGRYGFSVAEVSHAQSGLRLFAERAFDVVIVDRMLPDISGIEICRQIRRSSEVPVIVMSGDASFESKCLALEAGASLFVAKPVAPTLLAGYLRHLVKS